MDIHIPVYCDVLGCWNEWRVSGKDERNHPVRACCDAHKQAVIEFRHNLYIPRPTIVWQGVDYGLRGKFTG